MLKPFRKKRLFITFEGIEGSGKSTQISALKDWLEKEGFKARLTREPGGTPLADRIRQDLLEPKATPLTPLQELFLFEIARRDHVEEVIRPALKRGEIVLCDRFTDATLAYQGYGRRLSIQMIKTLNEIATTDLKPDLTLLLDLPVATGLKRAKKRNHQLDRMEREKKEFHKRVREGYLTLAAKEKRRFRVIDGRHSPKSISAEICHEVARRISKDR